MQSGHSTLEELLTSIETDDTLKGGQEETEQTIGQSDDRSGEQGAGLRALLSNPELLAKLPALIKVVQTLTTPSPPVADKRPETPEALLCALRPYLSEGRRQALDAMIRISRLSETLRSL